MGRTLKGWIMKKLSVVVLAALTAFSGVLPAGAAPFSPAVKHPAVSSVDITDVQYRRDDRGRDRHYRRPPPPRHGWHNGHRGYRAYRPGYRRHNDGWWYPLAAFTAGAVIGGAIANPGVAAPARPPRGLSQAHVDWCMSRYRTYRVFDNSYVPQVGVRAQCISPYS